MKIQLFSIIGISVRTTIENGQAVKDIPALWNRFIAEDIAAKIPGKTDQSIYCVYTDYEKDHTRPYTTILGCKVDSVDNIPAGMVSKTINEQNYSLHTAVGNLLQGAVYNEWMKIWNANLPRIFTADFEVYGEKAQDTDNATVDIFIAVK